MNTIKTLTNKELARVLLAGTERYFSLGGINGGRSFRSSLLDGYQDLVMYPFHFDDLETFSDEDMEDEMAQRIKSEIPALLPPEESCLKKISDDVLAILFLLKLQTWYEMAVELSNHPYEAWKDDYGIFTKFQSPRVKKVCHLLGLKEAFKEYSYQFDIEDIFIEQKDREYSAVIARLQSTLE